MKPLIEFEDVCYSYGSPDAPAAVHHVSFQIHSGQMTAIIGSNGAGKTTVSKLMNGLLKPTSGRVLVEGRSTAEVPTSVLARSVGMLFQNPDYQLCQPSAFEEVAFTLRLHGVEEDEVKMRTDDVLARFDLDPQADPVTLSRSGRQYLALASVIAARPQVLILDEPTNGMDGRACRRVMDCVQEMCRTGCAVVLITHDMELAFDTAQRVLVMAQGCLIADGGPETVFRDSHALNAASVLPPQIIDVSQRMAAQGGDARLFAHAANVHEVTSVMKAVGLDRKMAAKRAEVASSEREVLAQ